MIKQTEQAIDIENVQAIEHLSVPIRAGVVVELSGPSGAGKSTALRAVATGIQQKGGRLLPTDGRAAGSIRLPGVTVRIGARTSSRGEAEHNWVLVEDTSGIGVLIDPDIKDPVAADKRRIEQLVAMSGSGGSADAIRGFLGERLSVMFAVEIEQFGTMPLVDAVAALKKLLEQKARDAEGEMDRLVGELAGIGEVPAVIESRTDQEIAEIRERYGALNKQVEELTRRQVAAHAASQALEEIPCVELSAIAALEQETADLKTEGESIELQIAALQEALRLNAEDQTRKCTLLKSYRYERKRYEDAQAKLLGAVPETERQAAMAACREAEQQLVEATQSQKDAVAAEQKRQRILELRSKQELTEAMAETLRTQAKQTHQILAAAVGTVGGFSVNPDGRLCCEHKRGVIPYSELSPGERAIRAIEVVVGTVESGPEQIPVIPLPQEAWEIISGNYRQEVVEYAAKRGVCIVTCRPSDDTRAEGIEVRVLEQPNP